jgi:hypothetical protein
VGIATSRIFIIDEHGEIDNGGAKKQSYDDDSFLLLFIITTIVVTDASSFSFFLSLFCFVFASQSLTLQICELERNCGRNISSSGR